MRCAAVMLLAGLVSALYKKRQGLPQSISAACCNISNAQTLDLRLRSRTFMSALSLAGQAVPSLICHQGNSPCRTYLSVPAGPSNMLTPISMLDFSGTSCDIIHCQSRNRSHADVDPRYESGPATLEGSKIKLLKRGVTGVRATIRHCSISMQHL